MKTETKIGCYLGLFSIATKVPLFCAVLYGCLEASGAPQWAWLAFWGYVVLTVLIALLGTCIELALKD